AGRIPLPALDLDPATAGPVRDPRVVVETEGPVRTELLFTGTWPGDVAYELRLAAFAGLAALRVQLTVTSMGSSAYTRIRGLGLAVPGTFGGGAVGVDGASRAQDDLGRPVVLRQPDAAGAFLGDAPAGRRGDGWLEAAGADGRVLLARRWFAEEWP